jgi:hypothetical protein
VYGRCYYNLERKCKIPTRANSEHDQVTTQITRNYSCNCHKLHKLKPFEFNISTVLLLFVAYGSVTCLIDFYGSLKVLLRWKSVCKVSALETQLASHLTPLLSFSNSVFYGQNARILTTLLQRSVWQNTDAFELTSWPPDLILIIFIVIWLYSPSRALASPFGVS